MNMNQLKQQYSSACKELSSKINGMAAIETITERALAGKPVAFESDGFYNVSKKGRVLMIDGLRHGVTIV